MPQAPYLSVQEMWRSAGHAKRARPLRSRAPPKQPGNPPDQALVSRRFFSIATCSVFAVAITAFWSFSKARTSS